jgi:hypothetical protein
LPVPTLRAFLLTFRYFAAGGGACPPRNTGEKIFREVKKMEKKVHEKHFGKRGRANVNVNYFSDNRALPADTGEVT